MGRVSQLGLADHIWAGFDLFFGWARSSSGLASFWAAPFGLLPAKAQAGSTKARFAMPLRT